MPTQSDAVKQYLNANIFEELKITTLSPEEQMNFLDAFGNVIQMRLTKRLMETLNEEQKDRLETILTSNPENGQAFGEFLLSEVPQFKDIAEEEIADYKRELVERVKTEPPAEG